MVKRHAANRDFVNLMVSSWKCHRPTASLFSNIDQLLINPECRFYYTPFMSKTVT